MKKVGRYIIRGQLGKGGMGKVFKVELPPIGKIAALKLLDPDPLLTRLMGYERLHALFVKEAVTMAAIRHPNVIDIHDFDLAQGKPFYVMDYFTNNLGSMIGEAYRIEQNSRTLSADKAIDYVDQTLNGLGGLHDAGILHRDIKPFNLLLTDQDTVKICDFGLSKLRGERFGGPANLNVGSPYYAAPEQEDDPDSVDVRADLYPVGIMFYRMLTGQLPDVEEEQSRYTPPSLLNPDLDRHWDAFIARAIARRPEQRFSNAMDMRTALTELNLHWQRQKEKSCAYGKDDRLKPADHASAARRLVRHDPIKIRPADAARKFDLDHLWRPKTYTSNRFEEKHNSTVRDQTTGLVWQQAGSAYPGNWHQARHYVDHLNAERFGGLEKWRLPTVEELITLLKPHPRGLALCIAPLFNATQRWIWSADRRSFLAAYYADVEMGFVGWQDFSAAYYVRAVCGPEE